MLRCYGRVRVHSRVCVRVRRGSARRVNRTSDRVPSRSPREDGTGVCRGDDVGHGPPGCRRRMSVVGVTERQEGKEQETECCPVH